MGMFELLAQATTEQRPLWVDLTAYGTVTGLLIFVITKLIPQMQEKCHLEQSRQRAESAIASLEIEKEHSSQLDRQQANFRAMWTELREQLQSMTTEAQKSTVEAQKRSEDFAAGIYKRSVEEREIERIHQKEMSQIQQETARLMHSGAQTLKQTIAEGKAT